jgi:hypothetical protein
MQQAFQAEVSKISTPLTNERICLPIVVKSDAEIGLVLLMPPKDRWQRLL